jgi:hypothetical protein
MQLYIGPLAGKEPPIYLGKRRTCMHINYQDIIIEIQISISCTRQFIDRFHSRDRWPQWGGETIRNI